MSTPSVTIQAARVELVRARGIPEAKPRTSMRIIFLVK